MFKRSLLKVLLVVSVLSNAIILGSVDSCCNDPEHCKSVVKGLVEAREIEQQLRIQADKENKILRNELAKKELQEKNQPRIGTKTSIFCAAAIGAIIGIVVTAGFQKLKNSK